MKVIYNSLIPFPGFIAINLFGFLFVRKEYQSSIVMHENYMKKIINHESIHTAQMKELGYIFFYIIYFFEWLYRLFFTPFDAYRTISFEQEAYDNESDLSYLDKREHYAQWKTIKK